MTPFINCLPSLCYSASAGQHGHTSKSFGLTASTSGQWIVDELVQITMSCYKHSPLPWFWVPESTWRELTWHPLWQTCTSKAHRAPIRRFSRLVKYCAAGHGSLNEYSVACLPDFVVQLPNDRAEIRTPRQPGNRASWSPRLCTQGRWHLPAHT